MRSTFPAAILSIILASAIHPSSARLFSRFFANVEHEENNARNTIEEPSCDLSDIEQIDPGQRDHMIENPYKHNDTYTIANVTDTKQLATFTGTAQDHPTLTSWCNGNNGRVVYADIDYSEECELPHLLAAAKVPLCVPKTCLGKDWIDALATFSESLNPSKHCKPLLDEVVLG